MDVVRSLNDPSGNPVNDGQPRPEDEVFTFDAYKLDSMASRHKLRLDDGQAAIWLVERFDLNDFQ
ncbi:hypothetical protein D3C77_649450 [compost metagenome]